MLSTSATYTSGAVPVNAGASCHAATVSAEPRLNTRQPIRRSVVVTSTRGLHCVPGGGCSHGSSREPGGHAAMFRQRCVGFEGVRGEVVPGVDANCSAVIIVTAALCGSGRYCAREQRVSRTSRSSLLVFSWLPHPQANHPEVPYW